MGKQISFVMTKNDEQAFLSSVLSSEKVKVLRRGGQDFASMIMADPLQEILESQVGQVYFWNTDFAIRGTDLFSTPLPENRERGIYYVCNADGTYTKTADPFSMPSQGQVVPSLFIRSVEAPIIDYIRPFFREGNKYLRKGRIWMEKNRVVDMQFEYKGEAFERWYDSTANWIRRHFHYIAEHSAHFGPEALAWYQTPGSELPAL